MIIGESVTCRGRAYRVTNLLAADMALGLDETTGKYRRLRIDDIDAPASPPTAPAPSKNTGNAGTQAASGAADGQAGDIEAGDIAAIPDEDWSVAQKRHAVIRPLAEKFSRTRNDVEQAAAAAGVSPATVYEWLKAYHASGNISSLVPDRPGPAAGSTQVSPQIEAVIASAIEDIYMKKHHQKPQAVVKAVQERCRVAGLTAPHANTVRRRIKAISPEKALRARGQKDEARNRFDPILGSFPGAERPLDVVQIDHTPANVMIVDEEARRPVGRPTLTLAIDVCTRIVVGLYISLEKPSANSTGMCLAMAILPKGEYLAELEIQGDWPACGKMRKVHSDNGKDFRGKMLERALAEHGIDYEARPVKRPHYGGHIERLMGTAAMEMRELPGTTYASPEERKDYDSAGEAVMTLRELETWLVDFIVNVYHRRKHGTLGRPPIKQWEEGILGTGDTPGTGLPKVPANREKLRMDFMPLFERTIQPYGVLFGDVNYYASVLDRWIGTEVPGSAGEKRKFTFRYDPHHMNLIWFFDPEAGTHFEVPMRNTTRPPVSLWELANARTVLKKERKGEVDEDAIFECIARLRGYVEQATDRTIAARRSRQRIETARKRAAKLGTDKVGADKVVTDKAGALDNEPVPSATGQGTATQAGANRARPGSGIGDIFDEPAEAFADLEYAAGTETAASIRERQA